MLANDCHPTVQNISVDLSLSDLELTVLSKFVPSASAVPACTCQSQLPSCPQLWTWRGREGRKGGIEEEREKGKEGGRVGRGEGRGKEEGQVGNKKISTINGTKYILSMIDAYSVQYA